MIWDLALKYKRIITYGLISCLVMAIDVAVTYVLEYLFDVNTMYANAIGVVTGFIIQYLLASKKVFNSRDMRTFVIFIGTFLGGLLLAELIIYVGRVIIFMGADTLQAFMVSKGASIVIPFFIIYFARKKLIFAGKNIVIN